MVAVVTGGASGIGLAIVSRLAAAEHDVIAIDRDGAACRRAAKVLSALGDRVTIVQADVGTPNGARLGIATAIKKFGRIDLLCNNAAIHPIGEIENHDLKSWREAFRVNVDGTMLCAQAALPHMKRRRHGVIINMGSVSATLPYVSGGAYAASKAAILLLTRVLALEAGPYGIRVNCISAGSIVHRAGTRRDAKPSYIPVGRFGTADDVAGLVVYLASDAASYVNGAELVIDGGATAGRAKRSSRRRDQ
jgi:NAD(P)-dependent dehydrogenase (short-subunit alcohol dehydrogenase family)